MKVEILYTAWNRLAYTRTTFELLRRNTDWSKVTRLTVYDDGSEDGTREFLEGHEVAELVPAYEVREGGWHSTGATMNDFVALTESEAFVKIDNDVCVPSGWLGVLLSVASRHPGIELLGMEAGWTGAREPRQQRAAYSVTAARHIGGVGLMRTKAFETRRPVPLSLGKNGRAGFTIWQHRYHLRAGWVTPDLPVVQLDRIPDEPWASLAASYIEAGWARAWEPYTDDMKGWWQWLPNDLTRAARASASSRSSSSPT